MNSLPSSNLVKEWIWELSSTELIAKLTNLLKTTEFTDIYFVGYVDGEENPTSFHPALEILFFEFEDCFLRLQSVEQYSRIDLKLTADIDFDFPFDMEEEDIPASVSMGDSLLDGTTMTTHKVVKVRLFGLTDDQGAIKCDALEFTLSTGQVLFVDPTYEFGFKLGSAAQEQVWSDNLPHEKPEVTLIEL